ncbi:flavodoxin family protein [Desulfovibrio sp. JC010]|uniref:flavodoxin family protein n=1 Tax=Desulfovibrio sp. JC010 TaxID=2593641 RepID=UPI0013D0ED24|nr:flavodoxin family protein [Desulfovibrio sp. JC010]NDV27552.1 flavodoxin family protein [Desulfovibrio sp. JC010]
MKILGISGSPRKKGSTSELVQTVLEATGLETEFISLGGKKISACKYCLACAKDNVCKVKDDMYKLREKLLEADGFVIGGCNMWSTLNGYTHNFMERLFQFHHQGNNPLRGKPAVAIGVGGGDGNPPAQELLNRFKMFGFNTVGSVTAQGDFACYSCGIGNKCDISLVCGLDENGDVDMNCKPNLNKQPQVLKEAKQLGKLLKGAVCI